MKTATLVPALVMVTPPLFAQNPSATSDCIRLWEVALPKATKLNSPNKLLNHLVQNTLDEQLALQAAALKRC
jgi:hypothetical protein